MKKMGFGRKKEPSQDANPYAQQPVEDPYASANANPYPPSSRVGLPTGPRAGGVGLPSGPGPRNGYGGPPPPYSSGTPPSGGYGSDQHDKRYYDNAAAFAANQQRIPSIGAQSTSSFRSGPSPQPGSRQSTPFGTQPSPQPSARGPGGYGGFSPDPNGAELRSNAAYGAKRSEAFGPASGANGQSGAYGASSDGYGEQRERTAEEQEEDSVHDDKNEANALRMESLGSLQRSIEAANRALGHADNTLSNLQAQGDALYRTEANLQLAAHHNLVARERTAKLQSLNRSMFAVHVSNPFTKRAKEQAEEDRRQAIHRAEKAEREELQAERYQSNQQFQQSVNGNSTTRQLGGGTRTAEERQKNLARFTFEDDDGAQAEVEDDIEQNQALLGHLATQIHGKAMAIGSTIDKQMPQLDRIAEMTDAAEDQVAMNRRRLERIGKRG